MFCPNCGNKVSEDAKFCGKCGTAVETVEGKNTTEILDNTSKATVGDAVATPAKSHKKKILIILFAIILIFIIEIAVNMSKESEQETLSVAESSESSVSSKYQNSNKYNIPCNGNSDLAIEAANSFADKYGGYSDNLTLIKVDASVSGNTGTYRYTFKWSDTGTYTGTTTFTITDYGDYRNYQWKGDSSTLFSTF